MIDGPFRGSAAVALGLVTSGALRGRRFRRLFPYVYVSADVPVDFAVRSRGAYLLVKHRGGALAGWSAAQLLGADCAPRSAAAEVVVPSGGIWPGGCHWSRPSSRWTPSPGAGASSRPRWWACGRPSPGPGSAEHSTGSSRSPTRAPNPSWRPGCASCWCSPGFRDRRSSTSWRTRTASRSRGSTSRIPRSSWRWSTTGVGTTAPAVRAGTAAVTWTWPIWAGTRCASGSTTWTGVHRKRRPASPGGSRSRGVSWTTAECRSSVRQA